ncbi:MAG: NAD(P)/FAD-dependent oxidoreductase [Acidobacteriota bacterium]
MTPQPWDFDVAVIGAGPGGSSAATTLARRGHRVLVLDREQFPRFHIGESQLPCLNDVLDELGVAPAIASGGFVPKWGANFTTADGSVERYADFSRAAEVEQPQSYQVERLRFDHLLLQHAVAAGATVKQGCRADDVAFGDDCVTLTYSESGHASTVRVGGIIDASGRFGFLSRRFGTRVPDPVLQNIAVHRQYTGVPRAAARRAGDIRMVTRPDRGWFWFIPISDTVMSVGAVIPKTIYNSAARGAPEESLDDFVRETPAAAALLASAESVGPARFDADYSYLHSQHAGDRFLLVGDAGAFLDPIFSTGVLLAMLAGIEAAEALSGGLRSGDVRRARFAAYEARVVKRYKYFRRFAAGFYDPAFRDLFFSASARFGMYEAVLSVIAGNWRPSLTLRVRLACFFLLVRIQRLLPIAARLAADADWRSGAPAPTTSASQS